MTDIRTFSYQLDRLTSRLETLPDKPDETPERTLRCLWELAHGRAQALSELSEAPPEPIDTGIYRRLDALIEQRLSGTPLAYLTGRQTFMDLVLMASPAALVPRRETEQLGYAAVDCLKAMERANPMVIDVCTGAGNVALGVAVRLPHAQVFGADISEAAIKLARGNAEFVARTDVEFRCGDLLAPFVETEFQESADLITCNPPYISAGRVGDMPREISAHEPRLAFDGGPLGVNLIRRIIAEAPRTLRPAGWLFLEVGAGQGDSVVRLLSRDSAYCEVVPHRDEAGKIRVVAARKAMAA